MGILPNNQIVGGESWLRIFLITASVSNMRTAWRISFLPFPLLISYPPIVQPLECFITPSGYCSKGFLVFHVYVSSIPLC